jgi:hypothetical protein
MAAADEPADEHASVDDVDAMLLRFLDLYRSVAIRKLDGLTTEQAREVSTPTGMTLLGIVKHLAWDERIWFGYHFLGEPVEPMESDPSFHLDPDDTVESVVAGHHADCERSRQIIAEAPSLDTRVRIAHDHFGTVDLRWIIVHMIEEVARHVGHMDVLREESDGSTGW